MPTCKRGETKHAPIALITLSTEFQERQKQMILTKTSCPTPLRGKGVESGPNVAVHNNGQTFFNKAIIRDYFGTDKKYLVVGFDDERNLTFQALAEVPAKMTEADLFSLKYNEKTGGAYSSLTVLFRHDAVQYDYKGSGNQTFAVTGDKAKASVTIKAFPHRLTAKPVTPRVKKVKPATTAAPSTPAIDSLD